MRPLKKATILVAFPCEGRGTAERWMSSQLLKRAGFLKLDLRKPAFFDFSPIINVIYDNGTYFSAIFKIGGGDNDTVL